MSPENIEKYTPQKRDWFDSSVSYEGRGHAEFLKPKGWIEGPARVEIEDTGEPKIEMQVENYHLPEKLASRYDDLYYLLTGRRPDRSGHYSYGRRTQENKCTELSINTELGNFRVTEFINITHSSLFPFPDSIISFYPSISSYNVSNDNKAKYWVMPLVNFMARVQPILNLTHPIIRHPLRIFEIPEILEDLSEQERILAEFRAASGNRLIAFEFDEKPAFIELLAHQNLRELESYQSRDSITALMIGEVGDWPLEPRKLLDKLPIDFVYVLSLATGNFVNIPWIELRDSSNHVVGRLHVPITTGTFQSPKAVVERGLSRLLSVCPRMLPPHLRVAIKLSVSGNKTGRGSDDNLSHLLRALDALCEADISYPFDFKTLEKNAQTTITELIKSANKQIIKVAEEVEKIGNEDDARVIRDIVAERVRQATNIKRPNFAEKIRYLFEKLEIPDADIMREYFKTNPRSDGIETLPQLISYYRGIALHENYFKFSDGTHDIIDIATFQWHVQDILLRVILKMLNYDGVYKSPINRTIVPIDWVQPDTPAEKLGYQSSSS